MSTTPDPMPEGLGLDYSYYDADDLTRRGDTIDYVAPAIYPKGWMCQPPTEKEEN